MQRWVGWVGIAMWGALGCGGRAVRDVEPAAGGSSASSNDGGGSGEDDGASGVHSILTACEICSLSELDCTGYQYPAPQRTYRTNLSAHGCDYLPAAGLDGTEFRVDCTGGPTTVKCLEGDCNNTVSTADAISFENLDGSVAFTCSAPTGVR